MVIAGGADMRVGSLWRPGGVEVGGAVGVPARVEPERLDGRPMVAGRHHHLQFDAVSAPGAFEAPGRLFTGKRRGLGRFAGVLVWVHVSMSCRARECRLLGRDGDDGRAGSPLNP